MPKGIPALGYRNTDKIDRIVNAVQHVSYEHNDQVVETDDQIEQRIAERFEILDTLTNSCITGVSRALIVSGPAGLGKSYTVEHRLKYGSTAIPALKH